MFASTLASSRTQEDLLREREMWVDKGRVLLRENETKVVTTIGNYLNNLEGSGVTPQANFLQKITFDMLYTNKFLIRIRSRTLSISSECNTI